ncbi:hypothetical protein [Acidisarcina polymorpha]|uniref:hypothetical protein n=1 Tax=Acidisarcina polymorpha TaxID=2211140 RepID=UPI000DEF93F1|nr:hypothetical protein [Acidisarcina polymorpha]
MRSSIGPFMRKAAFVSMLCLAASPYLSAANVVKPAAVGGTNPRPGRGASQVTKGSEVSTTDEIMTWLRVAMSVFGL